MSIQIEGIDQFPADQRELIRSAAECTQRLDEMERERAVLLKDLFALKNGLHQLGIIVVPVGDARFMIFTYTP